MKILKAVLLILVLVLIFVPSTVLAHGAANHMNDSGIVLRAYSVAPDVTHICWATRANEDEEFHIVYNNDGTLTQSPVQVGEDMSRINEVTGQVIENLRYADIGVSTDEPSHLPVNWLPIFCGDAASGLVGEPAANWVIYFNCRRNLPPELMHLYTTQY